MHAEPDEPRLQLVLGDITEQHVDAIVNAANSRLAGGGGVDGAIHRRGGPAILQETRSRFPDGCPTGSAVLTGGGQLPAKFVIHAVGPVWSGGDRGEPALLADAYRRALELAAAHNCQSVAVPALSTGAYGYPLDAAARVTIATLSDFLAENSLPRTVRIVLRDQGALDVFRQALADRSGPTRKS